VNSVPPGTDPGASQYGWQFLYQGQRSVTVLANTLTSGKWQGGGSVTMDASGRWTNRRTGIALTPDLSAYGEAANAYRDAQPDGQTRAVIQALPYLTFAADAACFIPGTQEFTIPIATTMHAMSNAANGASGWQIATGVGVDVAMTLVGMRVAKALPGLLRGVGRPLAADLAGATGISQAAACRIVSPLLNGAANAGIMGGMGAVAGGIQGYAYHGWTGVSAGAWSGFTSGAMMGGAIGFTQAIVDPFICFPAGTPISTATGLARIETLDPGERLMTLETLAAAHQPGDDPTDIDPAAHRLVRLRTSKPAGSDNIVDAELIRPLSWIEEHSAVVGGKIRFAVPELDIDAPACVLAIEACPAIDRGRGRVITGKFTTARCHFLDVRLAGLDEVLHPTPNHRVFSLDRGDYIPAEELRAGERLRTKTGQVISVASVNLNPEPQRVYNLEIEGEHHYFVGECGVLVHNGCEQLRFAFMEEEEAAAGKPYADPKNRPAYAEGQVEEVWRNAQDENGRVFDPHTGEELFWDRSQPRTRQWDMGHSEGFKYSDLHQDYMDGKISLMQFLREYRNPNYYQPESWLENQSHKWE